MFSYKKKDNSNLFNDFKNPDLIDISNPQNYIPIYSNFFSLNETNYNNINLNHHFSLYSINQHETTNKFKATLKYNDNKKNYRKN